MIGHVTILKGSTRGTNLLEFNCGIRSFFAWSDLLFEKLCCLLQELKLLLQNFSWDPNLVNITALVDQAYRCRPSPLFLILSYS